MKTILCLAILIMSVSFAWSQDSIKLYNPAADAATELSAAIQSAKEQNKHVLIQVGGNWCSWCIRFHQFIKSDVQIDSIVAADYILLRINYSPENENPEVLAKLGFPQRFGFPVLLIVDQNGYRLHTQDTALLEMGKGYDPEKVKRFLLSWNREAVDIENYRKQ